MGVLRLFSREGQNFPGGGGQKHTICLKIALKHSSIYCTPAGRVYSKKKGYFLDEGEGDNFQA
jgi:hypothetical protein